MRLSSVILSWLRSSSFGRSKIRTESSTANDYRPDRIDSETILLVSGLFRRDEHESCDERLWDCGIIDVDNVDTRIFATASAKVRYEKRNV